MTDLLTSVVNIFLKPPLHFVETVYAVESGVLTIARRNINAERQKIELASEAWTP